MCGIVGYVGSKLADSVLLFGLYRLEYRGYDSAGVAVIDEGEIEVRKDQGKIRNLEKLLKEHPVEGNLGIGHTRWATHGEPNSVNAHPQFDTTKSIAVVHNGIIENFDTIRRELQKKNVIFVSETDTEVIPQLLNFIGKEIKDNYDLMKKTIESLHGRFAFLVIMENKPDKIFFCRNGSPLVYGRSEGEGFLVSDSSAFIASVKEQYFIGDGEWGWITTAGIEVFDRDGNKITPTLTTVDHDLTQYEKNGFDHFMLKEIFEQPSVVQKIIDNRITAEGKIHFPELALSNDFQAKLFRVVFTSAGTSLHAAMIGKLYIERFAKINIMVDDL
jgi:glucosamine--fructose-6-phosphate aminotransferase (isomerizing)